MHLAVEGISIPPLRCRLKYLCTHPACSTIYFVMAKAIWENTVIAESNQTVEVEGNQYFPAGAIKAEYFSPSSKHTECPWKGTASYYNIQVNDKTNADAAWFYPNPKPEATKIQNHVAFWKGVKVEN